MERMPEAIMVCVGECGNTVCDRMMNRERVSHPSLPSTSQQTPKAKPTQEQLAKGDIYIYIRRNYDFLNAYV